MIARNHEAMKEIDDVFFNLLEPVRKESVCDWVENNIELPSGAITGKVRLRQTPYAREILERYADKATRHLVLVFPTQSGKSSILTYGMLYRIARDPEDALWVMGNTDQVRGFTKERFLPAVQLCRPVMDLVPRTPKGVPDKRLWGNVAQQYRSMWLNFVGAGSPTNLSSRPRGFLVMDEVDKFSEELRFDSGSLQLAEERQKSFHFPLSVKASSPTFEDRMIWVEYKKTDMRQYWVPCPRCGDDILFKFKVKSEVHGDCGLRWWHDNEDEAKTDGIWDMKKVRANAFYKCQRCGGMIHDFEREDMLQEGKWQPQNDRAETGRYGYHLNSMYSILSRETSLGSIAAKFLIAQGIRTELLNFINGWLGEPWKEEYQYELKEVQFKVFTPQSIPEEAVALMAVDVQQKGFWVLVRKFAPPTSARPHGESWLLYAGFVDTEEELLEIQTEYGVHGEHVTADMAHRPNQVARMIIKNHWTGVWGSDTQKFSHPDPNNPNRKVQRVFSVTQFRDPMLGTRWAGRSLQLCPYVLFSKHDTNDMVQALRYAEPAIWHATVNVDTRYTRHINSRVKQKQQNLRTGRIEWVWHEIHQDNHLLDCECHVTIKAMTLGLLSMPNETEELNVR
jgi:DNA-directed RNA polymerase subunit RPC12/RpoP